MTMNGSYRGATLLARCVRKVGRHISRGMSVKLGASAKLDKTALARYQELPQPAGSTLADYIWIDGSGSNLRSRTRALDFCPKCIEELPPWNTDGFKTRQATGDNGDIRLMPVAMYNDPLRYLGAKLVLCETYDMDYKPLHTNRRSACCAAFKDTKEHSPLFGFCQQYMLCQVDGTPLGWPSGRAELPRTERYYCGVGAAHSVGRALVEAHAKACLYAGVALDGFHAEDKASKWKFETKTTAGIKAPDDVIIARYILARIAEDFGLEASFDAKLRGTGSGLVVKFTTSFMAEENGIEEIKEAAKALSKRHKAHMKVYDPKKGSDNRKRLGKAFSQFTWGAGDRSFSVRIPFDVQEAGCGYLEDRRPAANCDPYAVCTAMLKTICCQ